MPLPKKRQSRSRPRKRRTHDALEAKSLATCPRCNQAKPPHTICPNCGHYAGRSVLEMEES